MTTSQPVGRAILPGHADPIRIVPLYLDESLTLFTPEAGPVPTAKLTYRNGPLLSAVKVYTVFWGNYWHQAAGNTLLNNINSFFDFILTSPLIDQLAEYSAPNYSIGHGKRIGTITLTTPAIRHGVTDTAVQHMLKQEISSNSAFPQPDFNTLYFVYLPPGIPVTQGGSRSCQAFCGYHNDINSQIFYATMPYPSCSGCTGNLGVLDALTSTSSHELCEAITDPIPGTGWYDDHNGEIGDICAWKTKKLGNYTVQLEWSNKNNSCL